MGLRLRPGETCVVTATFEPKSVGMQMASGSVNDGQRDLLRGGHLHRPRRRPVGPDAGPDVAPPPKLDAAPGMEAGVPKDAAPTPDVGQDLAPDVAPKLDTAPPDASPPNQSSAQRLGPRAPLKVSSPARSAQESSHPPDRPVRVAVGVSVGDMAATAC